MVMAEHWQDLSNYCEKQDQRYMRFVPACPICVGEILAKNPKLHINPHPTPPDRIPNKTGLFLVDQPSLPSAPKPARPEQMSLF